MKILIEFTLDESWDDYKGIVPELIAEDMFELGLKEGITYEVKQIKK